MGASDEAQNVNPVARELMTKFLRVGPPSSWGVGTVGEDVRPPASSPLITGLDASGCRVQTGPSAPFCARGFGSAIQCAVRL